MPLLVLARTSSTGRSTSFCGTVSLMREISSMERQFHRSSVTSLELTPAGLSAKIDYLFLATMRGFVNRKGSLSWTPCLPPRRAVAVFVRRRILELALPAQWPWTLHPKSILAFGLLLTAASSLEQTGTLES